jgi:divalent metal cation (Fe/Co/Zn/Cd) transporter
MRRSVDGLMDRALPDADVQRIEAILAELSIEGSTFTELRTRLAGKVRFADVHLRVPADWSVKRAHDLADAIERAVEERTGTRLTTHVEPLDARSAR